MKKINSFLLIFTFLSSIFATNLNAMKRSADDAELAETTEETRASKEPRSFWHGLRTFLQKQNTDQTNHFDETNHPDETNHFDALPDELLVKILEDSNSTKEELINLSKVSRRFHQIALDLDNRATIHEYLRLLNSVINFDTTTNTLRLNYLHSNDRVKALLGFKFLIQLRTKSLYLKYSGIDPQTFCVEQYNALINFFKDLRFGNEVANLLETNILGYDAPSPFQQIDDIKYFFARTLEEYPQKINEHIVLNKNMYRSTTRKYSLLEIALTYYNGLDLIQMLVILGAKINNQSEYGDTPLHFTLKYHIHHLQEIAILLLNNNADFRIKNNRGETALELIARLNNPEIDKVLIPKLTWYEKQLFKFARFFKTRIR